MLLDCVVTDVIAVCTLKKVSKLMNFCVDILILKIEENTPTFLAYYAYYFKKGKIATEMQEEIYAVYGEGAMTD